MVVDPLLILVGAALVIAAACAWTAHIEAEACRYWFGQHQRAHLAAQQANERAAQEAQRRVLAGMERDAARAEVARLTPKHGPDGKFVGRNVDA
jgi:hypothetical protein